MFLLVLFRARRAEGPVADDASNLDRVRMGRIAGDADHFVSDDPVGDDFLSSEHAGGRSKRRAGRSGPRKMHAAMKRDRTVLWIVLFAVAKVIFHLCTNDGYGFHRGNTIGAPNNSTLQPTPTRAT